MNSLVLEAVTVTLNHRALFAPLTLTIEPGVVVTVVGPSGAGKSSLLACLAGALPDALTAQGHVLLGDELLDEQAPEDRRLGILFQDDLLFPHLSVGGNLAFGMRPRSGGRTYRRSVISEALASMDLA